MNVIETALPGVMLIEPKVFGDARGFFLESWNRQTFAEARERQGPGPGLRAGQPFPLGAGAYCAAFTTSSISPRAKLVRVVSGAVFDVAVDLRKSSPHFGKWVGYELSADNKRMMWVPPGFGHGFLVLSESADFLYKTTAYYAPQWDRGVRWNDPDIGVAMAPGGRAPGVACPLAKDQTAPLLKDAEVYP
jgi:dTDP-4-dehydrorhamnose 3,5-epimerase